MNKVFQIRGKLKVTLPQSGKDKMLGFKFILPANYPQDAPICYLDEPELQEVVDMVDYLDKGNRIMFEYVIIWSKVGGEIVHSLQKYNLMTLLGNIYQIFVKMPPVSFGELFGDKPANNEFEDPLSIR